MTKEVSSVIFSHIYYGSNESEEYSRNKAQIKLSNENKEKSIQQKKELEDLYEKTRQNIEEANDMVLGSISNEVKEEEFNYFDMKTNQYEKDFHKIVDDHILESRNIEMDIIRALNEAQQFEIETIKKLKA